MAKAGTGLWTLAGANTYSGTTTINAGTLEFAKEVSLYNNSPGSWTAANIVVAGGATLALKVGGANEFTQSDIGTIAALGTASGGFTNNAILGLDTTDAAGSFSYGGVIANPNSGANVLGLTKLGPNTLVLSASNTYSGPTAVSGGTLQIGNGGSGASIGSTSGVALSNGAAIVFNHTDPVTFAPAISGSGSLTQTGSGLLTLSGTNTYSGTTTINGGTLNAGAADTNTTSTLGTGPFGAVLTNAANTIVFGGGVLQYSVANHVDYSGRFSAAAGQPISIDTNGQSVTFATPLTSAGGSLTLNDTSVTPGKLVLAAAETYTGGTTIKAGEIKLSGTGGQLPALPSSAAGGLGGALTMSAGTLDLENTAGTVGALNGGPSALITDDGPAGGVTPLTVSFDSGSCTYGGSIHDGPNAHLSLTKNGAGTLVLSGADNYTGGTVVNGGDLVLITHNALGDGPLTIGPGAILNFDPGYPSSSPMADNRSVAGSPATVPEPGSLALLVAGLAAGFGVWRGRRKGI